MPVLATSVGGPPEIISDGEEGYLLRPEDPAAWAAAARRIADSAELGAKMGAAGRRRVQEAFTERQHADAVLAVYKRATESQRLDKTRLRRRVHI